MICAPAWLPGNRQVHESGGVGDNRVARAFAAEQLRILPDRAWRAEQIALQLVASRLHQEGSLCLGLNALRENWRVQAMRERDDCADDRLRFLAGLDVGDERPIDLDFVERER